MVKIRILFLGSQQIGYNCLNKIIEMGENVVGTVTFKPEPHEKWAHNVDEIAIKKKIPLLWWTNEFKQEKYGEIMSKTRPDLVVAIGWRRLLPKEVIHGAPKGAVGLHASLLPDLQGHAPVNWAIILGRKEAGITLFYLEEKGDTGDIIGSEKISIGE